MSAARPRVLHYAHQHGSGHVRHAAVLARSGVADMTVATAHPDAQRLLPPGTPIVPLPTDLVPGHAQPAGSPLHHTPVGPLIQERFAVLHRAALELRPDACVVDVSVEAALFLRLAGFPVLHRRMPGDRDDPAHRLIYAEADALFAHHLEALEDPAWQAEFGAKTVHLGVPDRSGRLDALARISPATAAGDRAPRVAVITGTGGGGVALADLVRAARAVPDARWEVYGPVRDAEGGTTTPANLTLHGWADDARERAAAADVVVVSAGHNAVVDAARSARPVVLAPEPRPFDEQHALARAAAAHAGVPWCAWEDPHADWAGAVETALADPAAADRLAAALLVPTAEHAARWRRALALAGVGA